ncbi:hypothetical protein P9B03_14965 [Metasolibacillus meyeri]|uniref:Uncharacterized protein n=1 Tax=Metasolibacillus meyeri TaxID=1071052 RepID=A0AAW9NYG2_9BACL|nr:hypothetical protein [Metasolibacillus meyeri]MEC1179798.1 hypothetical protein [Metasolibacillus meyeri]
MYQDFTNQSMLGYVLMIVVTIVLASIGKRQGYISCVVLGNIASMIVSWFFISTMAENENWGGYFKPLSPNEMLLFVSCLNIVPQLLTILFTNKKGREETQ